MEPLQGARLLLLVGCALAFKHNSNTTTYLRELGYSAEEHQVVTEDGYRLTVFRIPRPGGTPIIFMHGILSVSDIWVLMQRDQNLATILADKGYDIWLTNQRGNAYSHEHVTLSTDPGNYKYWEFSAEEIATKDIPGLMDYILQITGRDQVFYMSHSMGGALFGMLCSKRPEYCRRLVGVVLLAPVVFAPEQVRLLPIRLVTQWAESLGSSMRKKGVYEFFGRDQLIADVMYKSCQYDRTVCSLMLQSLHFSRKEQQDLYRPFGDYIAALIGGTSVRVYEHMSYIVSRQNGKFGPLPRIWHDSTPPSNETYKLHDIEIPIALFYAEDDIFIDQQAIDQLTSKLKNVVINEKIPAPFKHEGYFYKLKHHYGIVKSIEQFLGKYDSQVRYISQDPQVIGDIESSWWTRLR